LERRLLEKLDNLLNRFLHCKKGGDAATYMLRKKNMDACKPTIGDCKTK